MDENSLKILKQMLELSKKLNLEYITFWGLQNEINKRIELAEEIINQ